MPFTITINDVEVTVTITRVEGILTVDATVTLVATSGRRYEDDALTPTLTAAQRTAINNFLDNVIAQAKDRRGIA